MVLAEALTPARYEAILLDQDGTITNMSELHQSAWHALLETFLHQWSRRTGKPVEPPRFPHDYFTHLDGRPRIEGLSGFLASRGISLPRGRPDDRTTTLSVCGVANRKEEHLRRALRVARPEVFPDAMNMIDAACRIGLPVAVVSSSRNCTVILERAGLRDRFALVVSGADCRPGGRRGKPAPDLFLHAADRLGVHPRRAVVVEDSIAGVEAGRQGRFGLVVGIDRGGRAAALRAHGADAVLTDLADLLALIAAPVPAPC